MPERPFPPSLFIHRVVWALLRAALVVAGFVVAGLLLVFGIVLAVVMLVWALLRGRRPVFQFKMRRQSEWARGGFRRGGGTAHGRVQDVVDVEVREVPQEAHKLPRA